jgi:uncharacterized protein
MNLGDEESMGASLDAGFWNLIPSDATLRTFHVIEPPRLMKAPGFPWAHEIRVALPWDYHETDKAYPVLWVTDNALEYALFVLDGPNSSINLDIILVSVGAGPVSARERAARRIYDFTPLPGLFFEGPCGDAFRREWSKGFPELLGSDAVGGARAFLDFLIDDVRSVLATEYRMAADDHGIVGVSAGGRFVAYALFRRPGAFHRFICGSPYVNAGDFEIFKMEEQYAAEHDDLAAHVFLGAGELEITEPLISSAGIVSSMVRLAETLTTRAYPSLQLTVKLFPGESHCTMWHPILSSGLRAVWKDKLR